MEYVCVCVCVCALSSNIFDYSQKPLTISVENVDTPDVEGLSVADELFPSRPAVQTGHQRPAQHSTAQSSHISTCSYPQSE